jgi:hypothetical protein
MLDCWEVVLKLSCGSSVRLLRVANAVEYKDVWTTNPDGFHEILIFRWHLSLILGFSSFLEDPHQSCGDAPPAIPQHTSDEDKLIV